MTHVAMRLEQWLNSEFPLITKISLKIEIQLQLDSPRCLIFIVDLIKVDFAAPSQNNRVNCCVLSYTLLVLRNFTIMGK